ncbi:MAG TPA: CoA-binding protein [Terriglobales bacterium]|nr:CoA-binding protein [Terriglobales bacterium]
MPANVSLNTIESFLSQKRIALVGISRQPQDIGKSLLEELRQRGHEVFPINPAVSEIFGQRCFARLQEIQPPPDAALILTSPSVTNSVVRDCAAAGVKHVWMYRAGARTQGSVSEEAVQFCRDHGIEVVPGQCPFMYLSPVRHVHWVHRLIFKIKGRYPSK